ncbi:MAG TPA: YceH family protein [Pyrinomonadaceae bacterium]|nr:YceH family protein [Pyrinomonadaceae bacterium]
MDALLNEVEVRVVGSLVEKQVTTPEYYPLTLNALVNACNQISNRDPVVSFDEQTVARALESLRAKNLVYVFYGSDSRVPKYKHMMTEIFRLSPAELAAVCVLMLRGPQTVGEVRGRTGRLYSFADLAEAEATLDALARREEPLVMKLPRQPGRKEARYAHLLAGAPEVEESRPEPRVEPAVREVRAENERLARLEAEVETLRGEVTELRRQFDEFKKQFE